MTEDISLPIGGITDKCGLCGYPVAGDEEIGLYGLNGVTCIDCYLNFGHYTPAWAKLKLEDSRNLTVLTIAGHPGTPYSNMNGAGLVIIDPDWTYEHTSEHTANIFSGLTTAERQLIYAAATDCWPDALTTVEIPEPAWHSIYDYHHRGEDGYKAYRAVREALEAPFLVTPSAIYAQGIVGDREPSELTDLLTGASSKGTTNGGTADASLNEFEDASADSTTPQRGSRKQSQRQSSQKKAEQQVLGDFGT